MKGNNLIQTVDNDTEAPIFHPLYAHFLRQGASVGRDAVMSNFLNKWALEAFVLEKCRIRELIS
jgi:hypothetical protein